MILSLKPHRKSIAGQPFDEETLQYVRDLNPAEERKTLNKLGISHKALRIANVSGELVKIACERGLTLADIGSMIYCKYGEESILSKAIDAG